MGEFERAVACLAFSPGKVLYFSEYFMNYAPPKASICIPPSFQLKECPIMCLCLVQLLYNKLNRHFIEHLIAT